nr:PEGA domain-containing protein [uncultured Methanospirillum sp.]
MKQVQIGCMKWSLAISLLLFWYIIIPGISDTNLPETGYISVISSPSGATVLIDGTESGVTPVILTIPNANTPPHIITLQKTGFQNWTTTVTQNPEPGTAETISATLTDGTGSGTIQVTSDPAGATVTCDGTDTRTTPHTYQEVSPGRHEIAISLDGYLPYSTTISVASGAESVVSAALTQEKTKTTGSLSVSSDPTGATVTIDGTQTKKTPCTYTNLQPGTYSVEIKKAGYTSYTKTISVTSGAESEISASLSPVSNTGSLTVNSDPSGASVYLNGVYRGISPVHIEAIDAGIYTIKAEKSSYNTETEIINLIAGQENSVQLSLSLKMPDRPFNNQMNRVPFGIPFGGEIPMTGGPGMPPGP